MDEIRKSEQNFDIPAVDVGKIVNNLELGKLYANGFIVGRSTTDVFIVPLINGVPNHILNISFATAKNLLTVLQSNIGVIEEHIGEIKSLPVIKNQ